MSSWDPVWEQIFQTREWGKYPMEEVIRFVAKNYYNKPIREKIRFLDLGCGVGSATWYLCREGFTVTSVDGSNTALSILSDRLAAEQFSADLIQTDIATIPLRDCSVDCIIDANCLMCNGYDETLRIIDECWRILKPGGKIFSYTPMCGSWGDGMGSPMGHNTYTKANEGPFAGMGLVRFSSPANLCEVYHRFTQRTCDFHHRSINNQEHVISFWTVIGTKNGSNKE